jgi:hypothetical protein
LIISDLLHDYLTEKNRFILEEVPLESRSLIVVIM